MKCINKYGRALVVILLVACGATSASADWHDFWHRLHIGYYRNNAWPDPFNELDANDVVSPFQVMTYNGWKLHNTIGHEQFRDGDGALLAAGFKRVRWIATQAPPNRRSVYVLRGYTSEETEARVAAVQESLASFDVIGPKPTILITDVEPASSSGAWATKINREWLEQMAAPRLPSSSSSGTQGATVQ